MRARLLVASGLTLAAGVAVLSLSERWHPGAGPGPWTPPWWVTWFTAGGFFLLFSSATALAGALFPVRPDARRAALLAAGVALTVAFWSAVLLMGHHSICNGVSGTLVASDAPPVVRQAAECVENFPGWIATGLAWLVVFSASFGVAASVLALLASPPRTRAIGTRVAIAILGLVLLVPALATVDWALHPPAGSEWVVKDRRLCATWTFANGGGETCQGIAPLLSLPLAIAAGGGAALHAGRPSWGWAGRGAVALAALSAAVVAVGNIGAAGKHDWVSLALVAVGLALGVAILGRDRARTSP